MPTTNDRQCDAVVYDAIVVGAGGLPHWRPPIAAALSCYVGTATAPERAAVHAGTHDFYAYAQPQIANQVGERP